MESPRRAIPAGPRRPGGRPGRANREILVPSARRRGRVIHAHRSLYGMMVDGRRPARADPAGLAAVTVLDRPVAQGPPVGVTVAATPSTSTPHPEALPATDE